MLHDQATTHKGQCRPKCADEGKRFCFAAAGTPLQLREWLKERRIVEAKVPAAWTSKRPNDHMFFNYLLRWKYDYLFAEISSKDNFVEPALDTDAQKVLIVLVLTIR